MTPDPTKVYVRCPNKACAKVLSFKVFPNYKEAPIECPHCHTRGIVRDFVELRPRVPVDPARQPVQTPLQPSPSQPSPLQPQPSRQPSQLSPQQPSPQSTMRLREQPVAVVTLENVDTGESHNLLPGDNVVGRRTATPRARILFDDPQHYMSRCQAVITMRNDAAATEVLLRDAGSANGTFVNGVRLPEGTMVRLADGDTFVMGKNLYRLTISCQPMPGCRASDTIRLH